MLALLLSRGQGKNPAGSVIMFCSRPSSGFLNWKLLILRGLTLGPVVIMDLTKRNAVNSKNINPQAPQLKAHQNRVCSTQ